MALPPKGSPQRPLHLAIRSTRLLGIVFLVFAGCGTMPMFYMARGGGGGGMPTWYGLSMMAGLLLLYFAPGALYLVCAVFMRRRRTWAVVVAMVVAGMQLLFLLVGLIALIVTQPMRETPAIFIPLGVMALLIVALGQLEYHLARSFEAIRQSPVDVQRGFEPLPVIPNAAPTLYQNDQSR